MDELDPERSWQAVASLRDLRPRVETAGSDARALWQLPDWDAYSARSSVSFGASASQPPALSVSTSEGEGDVDDAASSLASSSSTCVGGVQRSPVALASMRVGASAARRQSALRELHQRYAQQRQAAATSDASPSLPLPLQEELQPSPPPPLQQQQQVPRSAADDAAAQWLALLSHKVELLASLCGHDASTPSASAPTPQQTQHAQLAAELAAWRVGDAVLQTQAAPRVAETARALERALAALSVAVERAARRKLELFARSAAQLQALHREKLQAARCKHAAARERLAAQADAWQLRAAEVERQSALERSKIELQAATFRDKFEKLSVRFDEDVEQITQQLAAARRDRSDALSTCDAVREQLERRTQELAAAQEQSAALAHETRRWRAEREQLCREHDAVVDEVARLTRDKHELVDLLEETKRAHAAELQTLGNQLGMHAEDAAADAAKVVELQRRRHAAQLEAMHATYEQRVAEQARAVESALEEVRASRHRAPTAETETQTDAPVSTADVVREDAEDRVRALSRKCRALENLLDKKFEEQSERLSCASSRSSRDPNDTLFTDVHSTLRNDTWDADSLTSADTLDRLTPNALRSRPQSAGTSSSNGGRGVDGVPSNADILALVRKLESYTASALQEPESEQNTLFRTPEATRKAQPPPVQRRKEAARTARKPCTLLTSKPLRSSLASGSSVSSASPVSTQRHRLPATRSSSVRSVTPFY